MAKQKKGEGFRIKREQLNSAMEEFLSRGGRIKKIDDFSSKQLTSDRQDQDDYTQFLDYSSIETSNDVPFRSRHRPGDYD